jgi:hypothetical protein
MLGVQEKDPVLSWKSRNVAPDGIPEARRNRGCPSGSVAEMVNASKEPSPTDCGPGTVTVGAVFAAEAVAGAKSEPAQAKSASASEVLRRRAYARCMANPLFGLDTASASFAETPQMRVQG